jgi:class 3 adenylate cyclase
MKKLGPFLQRFFRELLLQSGQYALFYLLMQFSISGFGLFAKLSHAALFGILSLQTALLVLRGDRPWVRFLGSLLTPLVYTILESLGGTLLPVHAAHAGFWIFSISTGALQASILRTRRIPLKVTLEFVLTFLNVVIFLLLYFYFDTMQTLGHGSRELVLDRIFLHFPDFFADPTHVYITWGGLLLAMSLALGRTDILRLKERLNTLFGQYVDKDIRDEILGGKGLHSRQIELAVLFSDLRNFTACSEKADPQAVTTMLNLYFSRWTEMVHRHGGVIDKFIGDAVMVLFGLKGEQGACDAALACGRDMLGLWPSLKAELLRRGLPCPDGLGIGLHFGAVFLGDIGGEERRNFTVIGDTVNTASRLETACKETGHPFLMTRSAFLRLSPERSALCVFAGKIRIRGKEDEVDTWTLKTQDPGRGG